VVLRLVRLGTRPLLCESQRVPSRLQEDTMIRLLISVAFALAVATSAQAMPRVPLHQPDGMTTQVRYYGYGHRRYGYGGYRHYGYGGYGHYGYRHYGHGVARRQVRRCAVWGAGHVCRRWY
jgi:hypothetical protein